MVTKIPLDKLFSHPLHTNAMAPRTLAALRRHIARTGRYEPLAVRRHPQKADAYEIINGRQRKQALKELGHTTADCLIWDISDEETLLLLATLNRLEGRDNPRHRSELLDRLTRRINKTELTKLLPETPAQLAKRLAVRTRCLPAHPKAADMPQAMTFFVSSRQKQLIEAALKNARTHLAGDDPDGRLTRGDILAIIANKF